MANDYQEVLEIADKNNIGLSNTIKRDYGIPLDYSSIQETYESALAYAQTSSIAYIGQPVSVGDTLYIVTDEANGYLKPTAMVPSVDSLSVSIGDDGKIALKGFVTASTATLPRKTSEGTIEWVSIDTLVEGDGNTKTDIINADGSDLIINKTYDINTDTYTYTLDVNLPAAYDDSLISGKVASLETNVANQTVMLTDVKDKVDNFFAAVENPDAIIDTLSEIQYYITNDTTGATGMLNQITENTSAIDILKSDPTVEGSIQNVIINAISSISEIPMATLVSAGLVRASDEILVANDGTMTLGLVSTDKLKQGLNTLVLNGGSVTISI